MDNPAPAPTLQTYRARLAEKTQFNDKFCFFHFELVEPNKIKFQAGQYLQLTVPGNAQKKSYSISSSPQLDHAVEILVDITPQGAGTKYLTTLESGAEVSFMAPFGRLVAASRETPLGAAEKELVLIATGAGVAPMKSILEDLLIYQADDRPMTLYWGLRHAQDQCWFEDLELLSEHHPNFRFHPVLSQAPENWPLCRGRVTDCLTVHTLPNAGGYYLCGNSMMVQEVNALLVNKGIVAEHIHCEKFF